MKRLLSAVMICLLLAAVALSAEKKSAKDAGLKSSTFSGLKFRSIGPAFTSGRISDFAVRPDNPFVYYTAVASGGIWKTTNSGTTWQPVFDKYGAYAIGCLAMDPNNYQVLWAGTGENNSQRALGYGDGVYKSIDGGKSWKNMGLKSSRQIGKILIDPRDSDVVYVAAEGSVWGPGGERGLYKTIDGGKSWKAVLTISEHTGVSDMVMDPRDPDVIYAASHQRRRHVFTKIDGGPETAIYKTADGGEHWETLKSGLPSGDKGAIGLAISPADPDVVYAIIEASGRAGGFFRTTNRGATWSKMSSYLASSPQYYNEIVCDPLDADKVYSLDTRTRVTEDGGRTFRVLGNRARHVDDHALWIDAQNTGHLLIGGDGGIYESFDGGSHWLFKSNLPVTQFYRVAVDNSQPFYYVYGGTQDNNSMGGPSRNITSQGVVNAEWFVTNGGDGFWSAIDPEDPNIVYAESQYGYMVRYDRKSGESISIKPQPRKGEYTYRWNWNTPLIISPHSYTRLYVGANKLFRSDDRGNSWDVISDDLTRQIDRNKLPVMGKVWSVDAVAKNASTSLYGTIVSLDESPIAEDLLYVGTDDGLIQVTEDGGKNWRKIESFPGVPEMTYVSDLCASRHNANVIYASFDNRKRDDFQPYILKSTDRGEKWISIAANLPKNGTVHTIAQDPVNPELLFCGTEFGAFFTLDGGAVWTQLKSGLPTISVRDMVIQERENDLVLATFGRGFYILDDYTPLRTFNKAILDKDAHIFDIKDALAYMQARGKGSQGSMYYAAKNPPFGAVFTYYLKASLKTLKDERKAREKQLAKENKPIPYPSWEELRAEDNEEPPYLTFTIRDEAGNIVRRLMNKGTGGIQRVTWDLRYFGTSPVTLSDNRFDPLSGTSSGMMVPPGTYSVTLSKQIHGQETTLAGPVDFTVKVLDIATMPVKDRQALVTYQREAAELYRVVQGTARAANELKTRIAHIRQALLNTPDARPALIEKAAEINNELQTLLTELNGDRTISQRNENPPTSLLSRLRTASSMHNRSTAPLTKTETDAFEIVKSEFTPLYEKIKTLIEVDMKILETGMEAAGAPWTPGRLPAWNAEK